MFGSRVGGGAVSSTEIPLVQVILMRLTTIFRGRGLLLVVFFLGFLESLYDIRFQTVFGFV